MHTSDPLLQASGAIGFDPWNGRLVVSLAYFIVTDKEVEGLDTFVNGKAVAHASEKGLAKLCGQLEVRPLTDFISQSPEELAELLDDLGSDVPEPLPEEAWFTPEEGLMTVRALIAHLSGNPGALRNAVAIVDELREYEAVLSRLIGPGVRWHFSVDF